MNSWPRCGATDSEGGGAETETWVSTSEDRGGRAQAVKLGEVLFGRTVGGTEQLKATWRGETQTHRRENRRTDGGTGLDWTGGWGGGTLETVLSPRRHNLDGKRSPVVEVWGRAAAELQGSGAESEAQGSLLFRGGTEGVVPHGSTGAAGLGPAP